MGAGDNLSNYFQLTYLHLTKLKLRYTERLYLNFFNLFTEGFKARFDLSSVHYLVEYYYAWYAYTLVG